SSYLTPEMKSILVDEPAAVQVAAYRLSVNLATLHTVVGHGGGIWHRNSHSEDPRSQMSCSPSLKVNTVKAGHTAASAPHSIPIEREDGTHEVVFASVHLSKTEPLFMMVRAQKWYYDEVIKKSMRRGGGVIQSNTDRTREEVVTNSI
ncbi:MAG: hypothetical protein AAB416_03345, partial [Patescibacteria group bacterium]